MTNQKLVDDARAKLSWSTGFLAYWNGHSIPGDVGETIASLCTAVEGQEAALARTARGECASQEYGDWPRCSDSPVPMDAWCAGCQLEHFLSRASSLMEVVKAGDTQDVLWELIADMALVHAERPVYVNVPVNVPHSPRLGEVYVFGP